MAADSAGRQSRRKASCGAVKRVQEALAGDPNLSRYLGAGTQAIRGKSGATVLFSEAALMVAKELISQNRDVLRVPKAEIVDTAHRLFVEEKRLDRPSREPDASSVPATIPTQPVSAEAEKIKAILRRQKTISNTGGNDTEAAGAGDQSDSVQPLAVELVPVSAPIELPETLEAFCPLIRRRVQKHQHSLLEETIAIGEAFLNAVVKYGETPDKIAEKSELSPNTVAGYVRVATCFGPSRKSWAGAQLPASVDSLLRLSRLEPAQLEEAIKTGKVKPDMGRKAVMALLDEYRTATTTPSPEESSSKGNTTTPVATPQDVRNRVTELQAMVEECQDRSVKQRRDLIPILKDLRVWVQSVLDKLGRK